MPGIRIASWVRALHRAALPAMGALACTQSTPLVGSIETPTASAAPAKAAPVPATIAASSVPDLETGALDEIELQATRDLFAEWTEQRRSSGAAGHRVDYVKSYGDWEALVVTERFASSGSCVETKIVLNVRLAAGNDAHLLERRIGDVCCPTAKCNSTPLRSMLRLNDVLHRKDIEALRAFVRPETGLLVHNGWHGPEGESHETTTIPTDDAAAVLDAISYMNPIDYDFSCPDESDTDEFSCEVLSGGFVARFNWMTIGGRTYLVEITKEVH